MSLDDADDDPHAFWCAFAAAMMPVVGVRATATLRRIAAGAARG